MDKEYFKGISLLDFMLHLGAEMKGKDRKGFWLRTAVRETPLCISAIIICGTIMVLGRAATSSLLPER